MHVLLDRAVSEELVNVLSMPGVHSSIVADDAGGFHALFIQTESQRSLFRRYGDVLQLDRTYKVVTDSVKS